MASPSTSPDDVKLTEDGKICLDDPTEYLKRKPKKSILKMKQDSSLEGKDGRAHFDEMNILATYHPADKNYGNMKIDEPKTPYHHELEVEDSLDAPSVRPRRVSLGSAIDPEKIAEGLANAEHGRPLSSAEESDNDDDLTEEQKQHKREFEKKRRAHYDEGAALRMHLAEKDDDDEEEEKMEQ
ncbi:unnamed protein product [Caenorhabditis bovis]|uniref:Protein phosphatase inhibitor 2 n=1 Tax=Caenorhabditis bovis TaxID=2654633 RepID=A0A8S1ERQ0_9PELO|nr:unnamed protein product [Caenorhabditis bovis]